MSMLSARLFFTLASFIALAALYLAPSPLVSKLCSSTCRSDIDQKTHAGYLEYECAGKPFQSTWGSWWHPERSDAANHGHRTGAGATTRDWNILYHLGGNGPWVEKVIDVVDGGIALPEGCEVEQVHMMSRHAERYPTTKAGNSE